MKGPVGFQWDKGNSGKNWKKHSVTDQECEEVFFDQGKKVVKDYRHSWSENRWILIGETTKQRLLVVVFTIRNDLVRIISARDINKRERKLYEKNK
jgi:uncharacterized DUF497 family protein